MIELLAVGHVALDHTWEIGDYPARPTKTPARRYAALVGGMSANAAVAAARLGAAARYAGPIGDEPEVAARYAEHFAAEDVDAAGMRVVPGAGSSVSAVVIDADGERLIVIHRGSALELAPPFDPAAFGTPDVLLTDPRCPTWAEAALRLARERGVPSVLDADSAPRADLRRLVGHARWAVFSEPGLAAYSDAPPEAALDEALAAGAEVAVVTRGGNGVLWRRRGGPPELLPAFAVAPVVDTLGAGDVFHAGLGVALAEGRGIRDALRFGAAAAALKCQRPNGVLGAPRRAEVEALLASA